MTNRFSPAGRRYMWRPDTPDHRDTIYRKQRALRLPSHVDLRPHCRGIKNQGQLGSCTGHAVGAYIDFLHPNLPAASRLFIYYNERLLEGTVNEDAGAMIRTGIKAVAQFGASKETLWPYRPEEFAVKPVEAAYAYGNQHRISVYARVNTLVDLKASLANGFPVVFGMSVYESFESDQVAFDGRVPMPGPNEQNLGGHAVLIVGYDDAKQCVIVRNSWGKDWGDKGYFYLPYAYVSNRNLCDDFWTIRK